MLLAETGSWGWNGTYNKCIEYSIGRLSMSKFKLLFDRLQQLLTERIRELDPAAVASRRSADILAGCTQNEMGRKALLLELPSALYACLNRQYGHTTAPTIVRIISQLANLVFADAHPKYQARPLGKPKLSNLFGQYRRFFVQQFNLNSLLVVERLQSANYYTQVFSLNMLVRQLIQVSTESYLAKLKKLTDKSKNEELLARRQTPLLEEIVEELGCETEVHQEPNNGTASSKQSKSTTFNTERKESKSLALNLGEKKNSLSQAYLIIGKENKPEPPTECSSMILMSLPKQLSVAQSRKVSLVKAVEQKNRVLRPLNSVVLNRSPSSESVLKLDHRNRFESVVQRKLHILEDLYSPLALEARSLRELATLDERQIRAQLRNNLRRQHQNRRSLRSSPGGSTLE